MKHKTTHRAIGILGAVLLLSGCKQTPKKVEAEVANAPVEKVQITNPMIKGHYADPTMVKHEGKYYLYATIDPWGGDELAVFESSDFLNWEQKHLNWPTLEACQSENSSDSRVWAPCVIQGTDGKFYMYVSVGSEIYVGVSKQPLGPWKNAKADNSPLIGKNLRPDYHMIDAEAFIDDDGKAYLYWGSALQWDKESRCFAVELNPDMVSFDTSQIKDVTPPHYFEAPFILKKDGTYFLMYSEGKCIDATYMVWAAKGKTPMGPFTQVGDGPILSTSKDSTTLGPGHHAMFQEKGQDYILYHRIKDNNNTLLRELAIDSLNFDAEGNMLKVAPRGGITHFNAQ